jgi:hypothetical protein
MKRSYAVVWSENGTAGAGRLEMLHDAFELHGRGRRLSIPLVELASASIARRNDERLHGLPVLALTRRAGTCLRIASLEGVGVLHELAARLSDAGLGLPPAA